MLRKKMRARHCILQFIHTQCLYVCYFDMIFFALLCEGTERMKAPILTSGGDIAAYVFCTHLYPCLGP